jgi:hypothetical protein
MTGLPTHIRRFALATAFAATLALGGCGGIDGMEVNGKLFDFFGVSSSSLENSKKEPQMAARAPLVLPPNADRLPEPGSGQQGNDALASLNDPELKKAAAAKERERLHLAYCRGEMQWKEKAFTNSSDASANKSPYGPCPSLFGTAQGMIDPNKK